MDPMGMAVRKTGARKIPFYFSFPGRWTMGFIPGGNSPRLGLRSIKARAGFHFKVTPTTVTWTPGCPKNLRGI